MSIVGNLRRQAMDSPNAIAITEAHRTTTYAELFAAAHSYALLLERLGHEQGDPVAIVAGPSTEFVTASLAVLMRGGCYVPIDERQPTQRIRGMIEDCGSRIVIGGPILDGVAQMHFLGTEDIEPVLDPVTDMDVPEVGTAYIIYTSGSTGKPKGVAVSEANIMHLFAATRPTFSFGPHDVWASVHSPAFDFSVWEIWGALLHGGRLVIVDGVTSRDPARLLNVLVRERVTVLNQTPAAFYGLAASAHTRGYPQLCLRLIIFGGDRLRVSELKGWAKAYGLRAPRLFNMYGITEITVHATLHEITATDIQSDGSPIGHALPGVELTLRDEALQIVERGQDGEICVSGPGVANGYVNQPELTASRFVSLDPSAPHRKTYLSGDIAFQNPSGVLIYRGRVDRQVKINGHRIELGEVEVAARAVIGVDQVCATTEYLDNGHQRIVCFYTSGVGLSADEVRSALRCRLPGYMVPGRIELVNQIPLTANGKVDIRALLGSIPDASTSKSDGAADALLALIQELWREVLQVDNVGPRTSFFDSGGDSILAVKLMARLEQLGIEIAVSDFLEDPTPHGLARLANAQAGQRREVTGDDMTGSYPLAASQLSVIFDAKSRSAEGLHHGVIGLRFPKQLNISALERSVAIVVSRHEALRTTFDLTAAPEPLQTVREAMQVPLTVMDCDTSPDAFIDSWWHAESKQGFDLKAGPLIRPFLFKHPSMGCDFALTYHHCIVDGWSLSQIMRDIFTAYDKITSGLTVPETTIHPGAYREFVSRERLAATSEPAECLRKRLDGAAPMLSDGGSGRSWHASGSAIRRHKEQAILDPRVVKSVTDAARLAGTWTKSVYLATYLLALSEILGRQDVVTGLSINGRPTLEDSDELVGLYVNVLPLRLDVRTSDVVALAKDAYDAERMLLAARNVPLTALMSARRPLLDNIFNYTNFRNIAGLKASAILSPTLEWTAEVSPTPLIMEVDRATLQSGIAIGVKTGRQTRLAEIGRLIEGRVLFHLDLLASRSFG
ncbi:MAG: amino acid adenylation domain-containing protein [Nocardioides sp.]|nr:amino acid adenylation domain-containing protein [Nocardioides sp.]